MESLGSLEIRPSSCPSGDGVETQIERLSRSLSLSEPVGDDSNERERGIWVRFEKDDHIAIESLKKKLNDTIDINSFLQAQLDQRNQRVSELQERIIKMELAGDDENGAESDSSYVSGIVRELDDKSCRLKQVEKEAKHYSLCYSRAMKVKLKQDVELEVARRKIENLEKERDEMVCSLSLLRDELGNVSELFKAKEKENERMGKKLIELDSKVCNVEIQLRKFPLRKIYKFYPNTDVELTLSKNPSNGKLSIIILEKGKQEVHSFKSIQLVNGTSQSQQNQNRFTISYADGSVDTFETDELREEIVREIAEIFGKRVDF